MIQSLFFLNYWFLRLNYENSNKDLYKHLGWAVDLLEGISDKFSSNKDIPKQVFLEMERIKKDIDSLRVLLISITVLLVKQAYTKCPLWSCKGFDPCPKGRTFPNLSGSGVLPSLRNWKMKYNLDEKHVFICSNCGHEFYINCPKSLLNRCRALLFRRSGKNARIAINTLTQHVRVRNVLYCIVF